MESGSSPAFHLPFPWHNIGDEALWRIWPSSLAVTRAIVLLRFLHMSRRGIGGEDTIMFPENRTLLIAKLGMLVAFV